MPTVDVNPGWAGRYREIQKQVYVEIPAASLLYKLETKGLLNADEVSRSLPKLALLEPIITRMVVNMIKGTVKYPTDDWSLDTWIDMGMDDLVDSLNYSALLQHSIKQQGLIHKDVH